MSYKASDFDFEKRNVSYSTGKEMLRSPLHFAANWHEPRTPPTDAQVLGSIVDLMLFDPEGWKDKLLEVDSKLGNRSKKDIITYCKKMVVHTKEAARKELASIPVDETMGLPELKEVKAKIIQHLNVIEASKEDLEKASIMSENVKQSPLSKPLYDNIVDVQKRLKWRDKKSDIPCIGYLDAESEIEDQRIIWDLKTARDASTDKFSKDAANFQYFLQAAFYFWGYVAQSGIFPDFYFVIVENQHPYGVNVLRCDSNFMEYGKQKYREVLDKVAHCVKEDRFNEDYCYLVQTDQFVNAYNQLALPGWLLRDLM